MFGDAFKNLFDAPGRIGKTLTVCLQNGVLEPGSFARSVKRASRHGLGHDARSLSRQPFLNQSFGIGSYLPATMNLLGAADWQMPGVHITARAQMIRIEFLIYFSSEKTASVVGYGYDITDICFKGDRDSSGFPDRHIP